MKNYPKTRESIFKSRIKVKLKTYVFAVSQKVKVSNDIVIFDESILWSFNLQKILI